MIFGVFALLPFRRREVCDVGQRPRLQNFRYLQQDSEKRAELSKVKVCVFEKFLRFRSEPLRSVPAGGTGNGTCE